MCVRVINHAKTLRYGTQLTVLLHCVDVVDNPANVAYHEVDLPVEFVCQFHRYIPNIYFSSAHVQASRSVVSYAVCCVCVCV